jgi:hypothetical protein
MFLTNATSPDARPAQARLYLAFMCISALVPAAYYSHVRDCVAGFSFISRVMYHGAITGVWMDELVG